MSNMNCSVVACFNNKKKCPELSFYSFPQKKHEAELRVTWINAVRRNTSDGLAWEPSTHSRICSEHFVGGRRSKDPTHPAYIPSIFPTIYRKRPNSNEKCVERFNRQSNRSTKEGTTETETHDIDNAPAALETNIVEFDANDFENNATTKNIQTQTDLQLATLITFDLKPRTFSVDVGTDAPPPDNLFCPGFAGHRSLKDDPSSFRDLLGITKEVFELLLDILRVENHKRSKISTENKLVIFLIKLKQSLTYSAIAILFGIHRTTVATIFKEVLLILFHRTSHFIPWPTKAQIKSCMPQCFRDQYPKCRVIIDCTEIQTETPDTMEKRIFLYSAYKGGFRLKFLIGIAPCGTITYLSKAYGGRSSDSSITVDSNLIEKLEEDDEVMSDKGFPEIVNKLKEENIVVVMPPFNFKGRLTAEEVEETKKIAKIRIHVERCIGRIKIFEILRCIPHELISYIDEVMHVCCVLVNLMPPLIKE